MYKISDIDSSKFVIESNGHAELNHKAKCIKAFPLLRMRLAKLSTTEH